MSYSPRSTPFGFTIPEEMKPSRLPLKRDIFYTTTELRQAWVNSIKNEKFGSRLPVRKLPFCLLRQQVCDRRLHCKTADLLYWKSDEDKKKIADKRKCFDRQWTTEISKRNDTVRPSYTVTLRPPTPPVRKFMTSSCVNNDTFFRLAHAHRPKTREEKDQTSRHFVSPEWKSEVISWKRFNRTSLDIHRLSLF